MEKFFINEIAEIQTGFNFGYREKNGVKLIYTVENQYTLEDTNTGEVRQYKYKTSAEKNYKKLVSLYEITDEEFLNTDIYYVENENIEIENCNKETVRINYFNECFKSETYLENRKQLKALRNKDIFLFFCGGMNWKTGEIQEKVIFIGKNLIKEDYLKSFNKFEERIIFYQNYKFEVRENLYIVYDNDFILHKSNSFKLAKLKFLSLVKNLKDHEELKNIWMFDNNEQEEYKKEWIDNDVYI